MEALRERKVEDERAMYAVARQGAAAPSHELEPADARVAVSGRSATAFAPSALAAAIARARRAVAEDLATERDRGARFLLVPVLLCLGAGVYYRLPGEPGFVWLLLLAGAAGAGAWLARRRPLVNLLLVGALVVVAGLGFARFETWRAQGVMLGSGISTFVTGRVARVEHQASGRVRLTIDVAATARPTLRHAPGRIRVTARAIPDGLRAGDGVEGVVRLLPHSGPVRPHGYDFAFEAHMDGIGATGFFLSGPLRTDPGGAIPLRARLADAIANLRKAIAERIATRIDEPEAAIAAALVAGVRVGIPDEANEALRKTGLAHVLSISGLHMALVAGTVLLVLRAGFALMPGFASRHPVKKYAALAALAAASYYLVVCGAAVAAQRSYVMIAVMLVALLFDRAAITMRNLAIAATIMIAIAPHEVVGPSFQMSFAATAALIAGYAALSERMAKRGDRQPPRERGLAGRALRRVALYAAGIALTSIIAGAATTLYGVWHFHRAAPLGLVANLAAMPVFSVLVMPPAVLAGVLMPFGLDGPALYLMGRGIALMMAIATWMAERTPLDAVGAIPPASVLLLTTALVIVTVATTRLKWLALPFAVAGALSIATRELPDAMVSEDGALVALRLDDGRLAVNRARPNAFVTGIWSHALMTEAIARPEAVAGDLAAHAEHPEGGAGAFLCREKTCVARHPGGAVIVHAPDRAAARGWCETASLIVIQDATARDPCARDGGADGPRVLTGRDLARRGSAEVTFRTGRGATPYAEILHAVREPYRPWNAHRRFSREARGLPPYQRRGTRSGEAAGGSAAAVSSGGSARPAGPAP